MKRPFRLLAATALAVLVVACDEDTTRPGADGTVTVRAYVDANGSGTFDEQDVPLSGATVTLTSSTGTTLTESTGANGLATFTDVPPGSYRATLTGDVPAGAVLAGASSPIVVVPAFGADLETEFRFVLNPGTIQGVLFRDENADEAFDPDVDTPAPGIPVAVFAGGTAAGDPVAETTTDESGAFSFEGLRPGTYTLVFTPFPTMELAGGNTQTVVVGAAGTTLAPVTFTGNLLSPIADARAAAAAGQRIVMAVQGVASFQPPFNDELFLQDETAGIQVFLGSGGRNLGIERGDTVVIVGETELRFGEAQLTRVSSVSVQGSGPPPGATATSAAQINAGELQHQLVQIEGATVTNVEVLSFNNQFVTLTDAGGSAFGVFADSRTGVGPDTWVVGGLYDVTGVVGFDNRFAFDNRIEVRGPEDVEAGEAPLSIAEARAAAAGTEVTVVGVVTWQPTAPDGASFNDELFIQDATAGIQVFARDANVRTLGLRPGDVVRVTGDTEDRFGERQITRTTSVVKIGEQAPPEPVSVTPAQIASDEFMHELVRVEDATVIDVQEISFGNQLVTLEAPNGEEFGVFVDSRIGVVGGDWSIGSVVDVTGVVNFDNRHDPFHFRIWVRSPADIVAGS